MREVVMVHHCIVMSQARKLILSIGLENSHAGFSLEIMQEID